VSTGSLTGQSSFRAPENKNVNLKIVGNIVSITNTENNHSDLLPILGSKVAFAFVRAIFMFRNLLNSVPS
jgi:hypothetical protein